jgi:arginyl-tRNA synthetase
MYPDLASKTIHKSHGILRFAEGKMSSRKGNIVSAETLIADIEALVEDKIKDRGFGREEHTEIRRDVAVASLKYAILRQAIGSDVIYDKEKSVSFEGDSGPYLQYATVRAITVINKAKESGISEIVKDVPKEVTDLEKLLTRFPEVTSRARTEYAPHYIVTYLTELSSAFNSYYANNQIIDEKNPLSPYRVMLTEKFVTVMKSGLWLLGIKVPRRM